jgi:cephalosporin hydroxylase
MTPSNTTNPLWDYYRNNRKKIIHKWHHYFDIYHRYFSRFRNTPCVVLEIGVAQGGSLQMWKEYFGKAALIYGLDINPYCKDFEEDRITILTGSQSDREFLRQVKATLPPLDIIIDDGGHYMDQQKIALEELFDHLKSDGIYLVEDTHTSYWEEYGGGVEHRDSFIEYAKKMIDQMHVLHIRNSQMPLFPMADSIGTLHFYDSILVIEKMKRNPPIHQKTGIPGAFQESGKRTESERLFALKMKLLGLEVTNLAHLSVLMFDLGILKAYTGSRYEGLDADVDALTMIGYKRLTNVEFCLDHIRRNQIPGDMIETGVWRGGTCIFIRAYLEVYQMTGHKVWVADSFCGLPEPDVANYPEDRNLGLHTIEGLSVGLEEVKANFKAFDLLDNQVVFLKGWFRDTLPEAPIVKLSLLRLDGDYYESTIDALFWLYPKLSAGGYCIVDDWGAIPACRKAVHDYRTLFGLDECISLIDWTGVFWRKEKEVAVMTKEDFNQQLNRLR